jgi:hypothetical protein
MAVDLLSCPALSAAAEGVVLGARITSTNRRNRLGVDTLEALECLKSWMELDNTGL